MIEFPAGPEGIPTSDTVISHDERIPQNRVLALGSAVYSRKPQTAHGSRRINLLNQQSSNLRKSHELVRHRQITSSKPMTAD